MTEELVVLNSDDSVQSSRNWSELIGDLRKSILKLKGNFISDDGSFVNYKDMVVSQDFAEYKKLAAELKALDWSYLKDHEDERKAFFINLYNVQMIHALAAQETLPAAPLKVQGIWSRFAYNVGGLLFTLDEIEHGILRCNKGHPNDNKPKFTDDARKALVLKHLDPRIHFALNCGAQSCPPIRIYQSDKLDQQLNMASSSFCNQEIEINDDGQKVVVSKLLLWYGKDFGNNEDEILDKLASFITNEELKQKVLQIKNLESTIKLIFKDYDWTLNAK
eukprot:06147.XXX_93148_91940_1 [CDS] Oithona nana genome sequencing.